MASQMKQCDLCESDFAKGQQWLLSQHLAALSCRGFPPGEKVRSLAPFLVDVKTIRLSSLNRHRFHGRVFAATVRAIISAC